MEGLNIGKTIRNLRTNKGITQEELSTLLNVSIPAISKWENGQTYPDITLLPKIANYFEVSIDELMSYKLELSDKENKKI